MPETENRMVTVDVERYEGLILTDSQYDILLDALYEGARLSYDKQKLYFGGDSVDILLRLYTPLRYKTTLNALKEMDANE